MKEIPLSNGGVAIVDEEWHLILSRFSWHRSGKGYAERSVRPGHGIMMHRVVNMTPRELWVDHINGDKLDNRASNLRACTNTENSQSRRRACGISGFRGVKQLPSGRYEASIMENYKRQYIGSFDTAEEAARAYDQAAMRLHRAFAVLNFPGSTLRNEKREQGE